MENSTDDEHFVIRVDGRVKSHHRRFLDALQRFGFESHEARAIRRTSSMTDAA